MNAGRKRVLVGMSGGVDSSVAALLLKQSGNEVIGVTMKISSPGDSSLSGSRGSGATGFQPEDFSSDGSKSGKMRRLACFGDNEDEEIKETEAVARHLGIPFYVVDLHQEYEARILNYFRTEYSRGRTPNPCVRCNAEIKFGLLLEGCRKLGLEYDYFATGHYARLRRDESTGRWLLLKARDSFKDQSYFLSLLSQEQLARALFPLGELTKAEVRKIARDHGLPVSEKEESQDFYAGDYRELLPRGTPGPIKDLSGRILGYHDGIENYTVGQRRGLGIASGGRLYVVRIDAATNTVYVGEEKDLLTQKFWVDQVNWIARIPTSGEEIEATVKVRYKSPELLCRVKIGGSQREMGSADEIADEKLSGSADVVEVTLFSPYKAVTPGQVAVFYAGEVVLGAGFIR